MLVLSRRPQQSIVIGHAIEVTVLDVRGDQVRLGIAAPREIQVHRREVYDLIQAANLRAAEPGMEPTDAAEALGTLSSLAQQVSNASAQSGQHNEQEGAPEPGEPEASGAS